jgi:hypothetical protein
MTPACSSHPITVAMPTPLEANARQLSRAAGK